MKKSKKNHEVLNYVDNTSIRGRKFYEEHGMTDTPEYYSWKCMKDRCFYVKNPAYSDYGGRGIKVCEKWFNSFTAFYEDMGPRPSSSHTIDRINGDGDYEPNNCRWATKLEQSINQRKRKDNTSGYRGISWNKSGEKWNPYIHRKGKKIHLGYFTSLEEAVKVRKEAELIYFNINHI